MWKMHNVCKGLLIVIKWCDEWLLPLNVDKCKGMPFTSNITTDISYSVKHKLKKVDTVYKRSIASEILEY